MSKVSVFWFRRDLRLTDNAALYHALDSPDPVLPIFIFDPEILDDLKSKSDARISFIHRELREINQQLKSKASRLHVYHQDVATAFQQIFEKYDVQRVYANEDYEPYAIQRDRQISTLCKKRGLEFRLFKDQVIFHKNEILKPDGSPYLVYTPYSKKWLAAFEEKSITHYSAALKFDNWHLMDWKEIPEIRNNRFSALGDKNSRENNYGT